MGGKFKSGWEIKIGREIKSRREIKNGVKFKSWWEIQSRREIRNGREIKKRVGNQELDGNQKWEARLIAQDKGRGGGEVDLSSANVVRQCCGEDGQRF